MDFPSKPRITQCLRYRKPGTLDRMPENRLLTGRDENMILVKQAVINPVYNRPSQNCLTKS
jgi:hypothetical protein